MIQKLDSALSNEITNYISGDFNFIESLQDRNRPSKNTIENDKSLKEIWEKIRDKYELVDSFMYLSTVSETMGRVGRPREIDFFSKNPVKFPSLW